MDRLTFALVALAVVALAVLPLLRGTPVAAPARGESDPSLREALEEDLRTGKITADAFRQAAEEEGW